MSIEADRLWLSEKYKQRNLVKDELRNCGNIQIYK